MEPASRGERLCSTLVWLRSIHFSGLYCPTHHRTKIGGEEHYEELGIQIFTLNRLTHTFRTHRTVLWWGFGLERTYYRNRRQKHAGAAGTKAALYHAAWPDWTCFRQATYWVSAEDYTRLFEGGSTPPKHASITYKVVISGNTYRFAPCMTEQWSVFLVAAIAGHKSALW